MYWTKEPMPIRFFITQCRTVNLESTKQIPIKFIIFNNKLIIMQSILTTAYLQSGMCSSQTLFTHSTSSMFSHQNGNTSQNHSTLSTTGTPSHPNGIIHYSPELQTHIEEVLTKQGGYGRFCFFMLGAESSSSAEFAQYKSEIKAFFQGPARRESELLLPWYLVLSRALKQEGIHKDKLINIIRARYSISHRHLLYSSSVMSAFFDLGTYFDPSMGCTILDDNLMHDISEEFNARCKPFLSAQRDTTPQGATEDRATIDDLHDNLVPPVRQQGTFMSKMPLARRIRQEETEQLARERADQERLDRLFAERLQLEENQGPQQPS